MNDQLSAQIERFEAAREEREEFEMIYQKGDRVRERGSGWVGTVSRVHVLGGHEVIDIKWDQSMYRVDDGDIEPFDDATERRGLDLLEQPAEARLRGDDR